MKALPSTGTHDKSLDVGNYQEERAYCAKIQSQKAKANYCLKYLGLIKYLTIESEKNPKEINPLFISYI